MKKFTLLIFLLACLYNYAYSQNLVFVHKGSVLENNATVTESQVDVFGSMDAHILVKNQGTSTILAARLTVTVLEEPILGTIGYCGWETPSNCVYVGYNSPVQKTMAISAGSEIDPNIEAMGMDDQSALVKAEYKLTYTGGQERKVNVIFSQSADNISTLQKENLITISQTGSNIEMNYNFPSSSNYVVEIYNIMGKMLYTENVYETNGTISLPIQQKGIYFYAIKQNREIIATRKFMVQ